MTCSVESSCRASRKSFYTLPDNCHSLDCSIPQVPFYGHWLHDKEERAGLHAGSQDWVRTGEVSGCSYNGTVKGCGCLRGVTVDGCGCLRGVSVERCDCWWVWPLLYRSITHMVSTVKHILATNQKKTDYRPEVAKASEGTQVSPSGCCFIRHSGGSQWVLFHKALRWVPVDVVS